MIWSCALISTVLRSQEMASACVQAEATIRAGEAQAAATSAAGWMTLVAGILALLAAFGAAGAGYWGVKKQLDAAKRLQADGQKYAARKDVYLNVASTLATGLIAVGRLADIRVPVADALQAYHAEAPKVAQAHMVAPLNVLRDVLSAATQLSEIHLDLLDERVRMDVAGGATPAEVLDWGDHCLAKLPKVLPAFAQAVVSMRQDLDLPVDPSLYENLVREAMRQTNARASASFAKARNLGGL